MPIPAIAIAIGSGIGQRDCGASSQHHHRHLRISNNDQSQGNTQKTAQDGKYGAIQKALEGARQDLLAQAQTDQQRQSINEVLDAMLNSGPSNLLAEFGDQVMQVYLLPGSGGQKSQALAKSYRRACGPVAIIRREVLDEVTLTALLQAFFLAFRERLLQEPDFGYLRQYSQFVEERKQTGLQQAMLDRLDTIAVNTTKPIEDFSAVRPQYCQYLINALKDHTIRGFAPHVRGQVVSLPLADIFLPLQSVEGRPALAEYARKTAAASSQRGDPAS